MHVNMSCIHRKLYALLLIWVNRILWTSCWIGNMFCFWLYIKPNAKIKKFALCMKRQLYANSFTLAQIYVNDFHIHTHKTPLANFWKKKCCATLNFDPSFLLESNFTNEHFQIWYLAIWMIQVFNVFMQQFLFYAEILEFHW